MKHCKCQFGLGFTGWALIQQAANTGERAFGAIPFEPGLYCLRVHEVGEKEPEAIIAAYRQSPQYRAFQQLARVSNQFFEECGFGANWGWEYYAKGPDAELAKLRRLVVNARGQLDCPILYIGRSNLLNRRAQELMYWAHPFNHSLWALLYSKWSIELAFRLVADPKEAEQQVKNAYRDEHGSLPPFMAR